MIALATQLTQRQYYWSVFKDVKTTKELVIQFDEDADKYLIYGYDGPEVYLCYIYKSYLPDYIIESGYSQEQNDFDLADFTDNFMETANGKIR